MKEKDISKQGKQHTVNVLGSRVLSEQNLFFVQEVIFLLAKKSTGSFRSSNNLILIIYSL